MSGLLAGGTSVAETLAQVKDPVPSLRQRRLLPA